MNPHGLKFFLHLVLSLDRNSPLHDKMNISHRAAKTLNILVTSSSTMALKISVGVTPEFRIVGLPHYGIISVAKVICC